MDGCDDLASIEALTLRKPIPRPSRKAVLVVGMSRSGTSLLAHLLHVVGAALPRDLMGASHGNPLGHFEPRGLVALNDGILRILGRRWDDPRPIPERWFRSRAAYQWVGRIAAQIRQSYDNAPLFVLKDPRLCRLLPLYLDALDLLDIEPLVVLQVRPATEVARSLGDRDDIHPDLAELLWLRSLTEAEWHSRHCPRVWVSMAEMLADWPGALCRIADTLRLKWTIDMQEAISKIASLLKPRMCHNTAPEPREADARRLSAAAWIAAEHGLVGDDAAARNGFDAVRGALHDLDRMYEPYLTAVLSGRGFCGARLVSLARTLWRAARLGRPPRTW